MSRSNQDSYLDNSTGKTAVSLLGGESDMGYERRQVIISYNDDGSPVYKNLRASSQDEMNRKIVKAFIECGRIWDMLPELPRGKPRSSMSMHDYAIKWLGRKRKVKQTTMVNYKLYVYSYIIPTIGEIDVSDVTPSDVQRMLDTFSDKSKKTLKEVKSALRQIFVYAISDKIRQDNPCDSVDIDIPSDKETTRDALDIEDYRDIIHNLDKLNCQDRIYLALFLYTGMRRGEVLGLMWDDIDFDEKTINVVRNATYPGTNQAVITTPKTKAGTRKIPLDQNLETIIKPFRGSGYVIGGSSPLTSTNFKSIYRRIERTIDMHGATLHVLRHSYLTYAVGETSDYKTVQGISGHADVFTLMNRYAHKQESKVRQLSDSMHKILSFSATKDES